MKSLRIFTLLLIVALVIGSGLGGTPARAATGGTLTPNFTGASGNCVTDVIFDYTGSFTPTTNDAGGNDFVAVVLSDAAGNYGDVDYFSGPVGPAIPIGNPTGFGAIYGFDAPGARPFTLTMYDIGDPGATDENSPAGRALALAAPSIGSVTFDPAALYAPCASLPLGGGAGAFSGPPLPGPEGRNLVLFLSDAAVLDSPGGAPTGEVIKACQTAFVLETSSDGLYGRIYVMGGWIPLAATTDVAEDYGQPGGAPIYEPCVGK